MAPRFINPHFLPDNTTLVSRRHIFSDENDITDTDEVHNPNDSNQELVDALNRLIYTFLELPDSDQRQTDGRSRKRRRIERDLESGTLERDDSIPFRLISNSTQPISLQPPPPPPPITREPECEDNEAQGLLRMQHAQWAAIESSQIIRESEAFLPPRPGDTRKLQRVGATLPASSPQVMILERDQPPRATRPPVAPSQLNHHPHTPDASNLTHYIPAKMDCPLVHINVPLSDAARAESNRKRYRKRGKMLRKERPPPSFWRPNPACGGKSLGYAMGYPCSVEALENGPHERNGYLRDTMRTCALDV